MPLRMGKLTDKQERFIEEYLVDLNATQAAIRAGYSEKTARSQGQRLLTNVDIEAAISEAQTARSERTEIDADWVLKRLAGEADADLADLIGEGGAIKDIGDWPLVWRQGLVTGIDVQENVVEGVKVGQTVKVKLSERIKRVELIGRHLGMFSTSKVELTGRDGGPIETEDKSSGAAKLAAFLDGIAERSGTPGEPDA